MLKSPIPVPYLITFITEFCVLVLGIYTYRLAGTRMGEQGFAEYALVRRTLAFLQPVVIAGMGVGIPRYVALHFEKEKEKAFRFFVHGTLIALTVTFTTCLFFLIFSDFYMYLIFGSSDYSFLAIPVCISLLGLVLHSLVYGYFRGCMNMNSANCIQLLNLGIIPFSIFLFVNSLDKIILVTGCTWVASSVFATVIIFFGKTNHIKLEKVKITELISYGFPRIPGDILLTLSFSLPSFWCAHIAGVREAGYVAFGTSLLNMAGAFFGPLSLVLLPQATMQIVNNQFDKLKTSIRKISIYTLVLTFLGIIVFELFAEFIIRIFYGSDNPELAFFSRWIIAGSFGYTLFIVLRSVLDAYYKIPKNAINIFISFTVFIVFALAWLYFTQDFIGIIYGFVLSLFVLGLLSLQSVYRIFSSEAV